MTNESRIIGMGETVMDILFHQAGGSMVPFACTPGGSTFNSMISVGRSGVPCQFVGYTGDNHVGHEIADFLRMNGVSTDYFQIRQGERAALSLAYLDSHGDADYTFYKDEPCAEEYILPHFIEADYLLYGSYFSICAGLRQMVLDTLGAAQAAGALVYYDVNFRPSHGHQLQELTPRVFENCEQSSIVRGSADDFRVLFGTNNAEEIYAKHISAHCPVFIYTSGPGEIVVCTPDVVHRFEVPLLPSDEVVSTVGAGDSFNAGLLLALHSQGIRREQLTHLSAETWQGLVSNGIAYAAQVCRSSDNYIAARE